MSISVRIFLLVSNFLVSIGCMLDAKIYNQNDTSTKPETVNAITLTNVPFKASNITSLHISVSGNDSIAYKYKIGPASSTDCSNEVGYSASSLSLETLITDDLSTYSDQQMRVCAVGVSASGETVSYTHAASQTWYLDRVPTIVTLVSTDQVALESDGSNKTIVLNSSIVKPYPIDVSYKLVGDSNYMIDHNLPATGTITIPENSATASITFQTIHNLNTGNSKLMQLNILKSDNTASVVGANYTSRYFISDVDAGVRPTVSSVYVGGATSCAILSDGTLRCWGANNYGQLGDGTITTRLTPITVDSGTSYSQIATSGGSSCGITTTGVLKCWGRNNVGQLGDNTLVDKVSPVVIDAASAYSKIRMNTSTSVSVCGITTTGVLKCWGYNNKGQIGDGTVADKLVPTIVNSGTSYSDVQLGSTMACGLVTTTGVLKCWGYNNVGQLGDATTVDKLTATVINSGTSYSKISVSFSTSCGIVATTGVLKCWGANTSGSVGDATTTNRSSPTVIDTGVVYVDVITRGGTTCGITSAGALKCWGANSSAQVGDGTYANKLVPTLIDSGVSYATVVPNPASFGNSCGITSTGVMKCWGTNSFGIGDGGLNARSTPVVIDTGVLYSKLDHISGTVCGITTAGTLKCWGSNVGGALGDGTNSLTSAPTVADSGTKYKEVHSSGGIGCGITTADTIRCWGRGNYGQLGNGAYQSNYSPVDVDHETKYSTLKIFNDTICAITLSGVLKCWGNNSFGQVGEGTNNFISSPTIIDAGTVYKTVEPNNNITCGITNTDALKCWGNNNVGQVGDGTTIQKKLPILIDAGVAYKQIIPTSSATCGITKTGLLKCWGYNSNGQVGDGTTVNKTTPTIIDSGTSYAYVVTSYLNTSCGLTTAGVLKCWGAGANGVLGDGTMVQKTVPTVIDSGTTYASIGPTFNNTCGITTAGVLKCWGLGNNGTIGDGTLVSKVTPTVIDSGTQYKSAKVVYNGCAITVSGLLKCWGINNNAQVGDGTTAVRLLPVSIDAGSSYSEISHMGFGTVCGLTTDGIAKCWGNNNYGQVGNSPEDILPFVPRNVMKWVVP